MSRAQCQRCQRPLGHCLCRLIPDLPSRTRVLILQHPQEARHALNTARLAVLGLRNSELLCAEYFADLEQRLSDPQWQSCLLFPGAGSVAISGFSAESPQRPLQLVVPDGTWRKVRKLLHLNPALAALPRVTLASLAASRYRLRKAPMAGALSTIEAIARALEEVEGGGHFRQLLRPFDALIEGQIAAMGSQVYRENHGGE
ncbi:tRNA-uridine aminocarboxypropyltransferase [Pseudomonas sp. N040]|uniref:tRNA-uridine aminocarboxypropyltransferase n=1 Tax=Pseudomonas sp. N040 TaxID=2785325 RepID=UPI0018A3333D|nr:DTW domain-containing protein [Pseudomonas sp. N040]MBF7731591.1 DTW domain-containing protein [Pseudomonas sp. N040]MBW7015235.1 DTW domain-containing protein [Pseudomonas sp. N040]